MDSTFLELWGNLLIHAAKGQKQMEEIIQWTQKGLKGFEDLTDIFSKFYGLKKETSHTPQYQNAWEKASKNFMNSFNEYLNLMGVVSKAEYLDLLRKYERLEKQSEEKDKTIEHLRMLLAEKLMDPTGMAEDFQELIKKQSNHFQELIRGLDMALNSKSGKDTE